MDFNTHMSTWTFLKRSVASMSSKNFTGTWYFIEKLMKLFISFKLYLVRMTFTFILMHTSFALFTPSIACIKRSRPVIFRYTSLFNELMLIFTEPNPALAKSSTNPDKSVPFVVSLILRTFLSPFSIFTSPTSSS